MPKKYLQLDNIDCYKHSFRLSNYVWSIVINWDWFSKQTIGSQLVRSVDSISANIAEGFGRYNKKDKIRFYRISQGSIKESLDWTHKAYSRKLLLNEHHQHTLKVLKQVTIESYQLIKYTEQHLKQ